MQQRLRFTVCAEGCETAEEQSDDEVRTSQVPERSEGKTNVMRQQSLPFTVLKPLFINFSVEPNIASLQQYLPFTVCAEGCNMVDFPIYKKRVNLLIHSFSFYVLVFLNLCI